MSKHKSRHDQTHATKNIDRAKRFRAKRLSIGLFVSKQFQFVEGALLVALGCGKLIKPTIFRTVEVPIPESLREQYFRLIEDRPNDLSLLLSIQSDLAEVQAEAVKHLTSGSIRALDNVLAIACEDPGHWQSDFDGSIQYSSLCNPAKLSELTGLSVIDAFPLQDIEAGGTGRDLEVLLYWVLFAERQDKISEGRRLLLRMGESNEWVELPPSDGLESEIPPIKFERIKGNAQSVVNQIQERVRASEFSNFVLCGSKQLTEMLHKNGSIATNKTLSLGEFDFAENHLSVLLAGLKGLMYIDQLPISIPWVTGAAKPKILGRITPGNISNWRSVVKEMAEYRPPAMKLRESL